MRSAVGGAADRCGLLVVKNDQSTVVAEATRSKARIEAPPDAVRCCAVLDSTMLHLPKVKRSFPQAYAAHGVKQPGVLFPPRSGRGPWAGDMFAHVQVQTCLF